MGEKSQKPLGTSWANSRTTKDGTSILTWSVPSVPVGKYVDGLWDSPRRPNTSWTPAEIDGKKQQYLSHARAVSYAMQGKSAFEGVTDWIGEGVNKLSGKKPKPARIQSLLGGAFLRMYLDGKVDADAVKAACEEIAESPEFKRLAQDFDDVLQRIEGKSSTKSLDVTDVQSHAQAHFKALHKKKEIAFRYTLNAVIGGTTGVDVRSVTKQAETQTPEGTTRMFRIDITFQDTYDFDNTRHGEYDKYRKKLARLLSVNDFDGFENAYYREVQPADRWHKTKLDNAAIFASFMYALEMKGWTPGSLPWEVTVPMDVSAFEKNKRTKH